MNSKGWNRHYGREKSILSYPDENLVRLLAGRMRDQQSTSSMRALDLGTGSGRHLSLLESFGFGEVYATDFSMEGLKLCSSRGFSGLVNCFNTSLPFRASSFDTAVAWGSLHYSVKEDLEGMVSEIKRILKPGGCIFATLRNSRDTYLKRGTHLGNNTWSTGIDDLSGTIVSFYDENELRKYFSGFSKFEYGWMERTVMGNPSAVVSHWVISAEK